MSRRRSTTRTLSVMARGVRPRYGAATTSNTTSGSAMISAFSGPSPRVRRPTPRSIVSAPRTTRRAPPPSPARATHPMATSRLPRAMYRVWLTGADPDRCMRVSWFAGPGRVAPPRRLLPIPLLRPGEPCPACLNRASAPARLPRGTCDRDQAGDDDEGDGDQEHEGDHQPGLRVHGRMVTDAATPRHCKARHDEWGPVVNRSHNEL